MSCSVRAFTLLYSLISGDGSSSTPEKTNGQQQTLQHARTESGAHRKRQGAQTVRVRFKVSITITMKDNFVVGTQVFHSNPL